MNHVCELLVKSQGSFLFALAFNSIAWTIYNLLIYLCFLFDRSGIDKSFHISCVYLLKPPTCINIMYYYHYYYYLLCHMEALKDLQCRDKT